MYVSQLYFSDLWEYLTSSFTKTWGATWQSPVTLGFFTHWAQGWPEQTLWCLLRWPMPKPHYTSPKCRWNCRSDWKHKINKEGSGGGGVLKGWTVQAGIWNPLFPPPCYLSYRTGGSRQTRILSHFAENLKLKVLLWKMTLSECCHPGEATNETSLEEEGVRWMIGGQGDSKL